MASALKRSIAFLLVLVLAIGMIPTAFAAEVEPTDSTTPDTHATDPPEETTSENTLPVSQGFHVIQLGDTLAELDSQFEVRQGRDTFNLVKHAAPPENPRNTGTWHHSFHYQHITIP